MFAPPRHTAVSGAAPSLLLNAMAFALAIGGPLLVFLWLGVSTHGGPVIPSWVESWLSIPEWVAPLSIGLVCGAALGALAVLRLRPAPLPLPGAPVVEQKPSRYSDEYELNVPEEVLERAADPTMWGKI